MHTKPAIAVLLASCVCLWAAQDSRPQAPPRAKQIEKDLYDMTERWQVMFELDGKLVISNARRDARLAPADGPDKLFFDARPKLTGWYAFTFIRVDRHERTYQVHTIRVGVQEGIPNSKPVVVSPDTAALNQAIEYCTPNESIRVNWDYSQGGEGLPGGWRLMKTAYSADVKTPPSAPGFEDAKGE
jgi:hypothetical protein